VEGELEPLADELEPVAGDFESPVDGPVGAEPLGEDAGPDGDAEHLFDGEASDRPEYDAPEAAHDQHDHEARDPEHDSEATAIMPPITPREDQPS